MTTMIKSLAEFTKTTLIVGLLIILPIYLSILLLVKTFKGLTALIAPVTAQIPATVQFRQVIAVLVIILVCFLAGLLVRTGIEPLAGGDDLPAGRHRTCSEAFRGVMAVPRRVGPILPAPPGKQRAPDHPPLSDLGRRL